MNREYLEALECLENIRKDVYNFYTDFLDDISIIKQALLKAQKQEKVLNIIRKFFNIKFDDLDWGKLVHIQAKEDDGEWDCTATADLIDYKEDFDVLKEWLKNDNN